MSDSNGVFLHILIAVFCLGFGIYFLAADSITIGSILLAIVISPIVHIIAMISRVRAREAQMLRKEVNKLNSHMEVVVRSLSDKIS